MTVERATAPGEVPNVVNILGYGRSGSTLLASLLGLVPGFVPVGELASVWQASALDEMCSCGRPFSNCPFWVSVGRTAFGGWQSVDVKAYARVNSEILTIKNTPFLFAPSLRERIREPLRFYTKGLTTLYEGIKSVSGASVIIDSTKDPPNFLALSREDGLQPHLVHLVRDSRGVVFSRKKLVEQPRLSGVEGLEGVRLGGASSLRTAPEWLLRNLLVHFIAASGTPRLLVRYESLIADPARQIQRVVEFSGVSAPGAKGIPRFHDAEYEPPMFHMVGGNRSRFRRGRIPLRLDDEWRATMPFLERAFVTTVTLPLLAKYDYVGSTKAKCHD
jgi:hypothetical protein